MIAFRDSESGPPFRQASTYVPATGAPDDDDVPRRPRPCVGVVMLRLEDFRFVDDVGIQFEVREQVVRDSPRDRHCAVRQDAPGCDDFEPSWRLQDRIWTRGALWCRWRLGGGGGGGGEDLRGDIAGDLVRTDGFC